MEEGGDFSPLTQEEEDEEEEEEIDEWEEGESDAHHLQKEDFFGCYLLVSKNPQFKGRTYIGYTVNPRRRIRQHNAGRQRGGARSTSGRGPWEMVLIVHGFPNDVAALRFEWAWQHPGKSRRLGSRVGPRRKSRETSLEHRFRILSEMLCVCPWSRLPLTVRWLQQEYQMEFPLHLQPPTHMPVAYGPVELSVGKTEGKKKSSQMSQEEEEEEDTPRDVSCYICHQTGGEGRSTSPCLLLHCYHHDCSLAAHATCLAERVCPSPHLVPTVAPCPACRRELLWGEMVRRARRRRTDLAPSQTT